MPSPPDGPPDTTGEAAPDDGTGTVPGPADTGVVSWAALPERDSDPYFLAVRHLLAGTVGGFLLVVGAALAWIGTRSLVDPSDDLLVLVVTLTLVGGPFSLLYVLIAADVGSERERALFSPDLSWLRLRWFLPGLVAGLGLLGLLVALVGPIVVLFLPFGLVFLVSAVDARYTVGRIDPERRTVEFYTGTLAREYAESTPGVADGTTVPAFETDDRNRRRGDLSSLADADRHELGTYTLFRLRYHDRAWLSNRPRLLVVPNAVGDGADSALTHIAETNDWEPSAGLARDVRLVLGVLGATFLGAVGVFALVTGGEPVILLYAGTTLGLLGAAMVLAALFG
jgi:hypothetical protein